MRRRRCPFRGKSVPGRLHCRLEPSKRGRREALVRFYAAAAASLAGVLQGVQRRSRLNSARAGRNTPQLVVFSTDPVEHASLEARAHVGKKGRRYVVS